jgi:hypothetical protein
MVNIILIIFFIWLAILSYLLFHLKSHYYNLTSRTKKQNIDEILDFLLQKQEELGKDISLIKDKLAEEINRSNFYFQKVGTVSFNPFDRGSEPSFALGLFDRQDNGLILNFLYTKEGLRVYPKTVIKGKGATHQLSVEEEKLVKESKFFHQ